MSNELRDVNYSTIACACYLYFEDLRDSHVERSLINAFNCSQRDINRCIEYLTNYKKDDKRESKKSTPFMSTVKKDLNRTATAEKAEKVVAAGMEIGAWTVNDRETMQKLLNMGVQRIYTDYPGALLKLKSASKFRNVACEGTYQHHLQGICVDGSAIYWSFTTTLVKTDLDGKLLKKIPVVNHHGDLCHHDGKIYVAVNLGVFNNPQGKADSWVYVYDAKTLKEISRHEVQEVFHGAGGMGYRDGNFFVVGGLPDDVEENYVYEYDSNFNFLKKHTIKSGHTHLGIQTATFAHDKWWFGCYGSPKTLLVTHSDFELVGRYKFDCSLGIEALPNGRLLSASGKCEQGSGCDGKVQTVMPNKTVGLVPFEK